MIRQIVGWALGPSGELVLEWYSQHNLLINGPIVFLALLSILFPIQRRRFQEFCRDLWHRSPLAATEDERASHEQAKQRLQETKGKPTEGHQR